MSNSTTVEQLAKAIGKATRSARFCAAGVLPAIDPGIEVDGLGEMKLPLPAKKVRGLVACCTAAPFGKGTRTYVDKKVRRTFELDPKKFHLSDAWNSAIARATESAAAQLGLPADQLEARLYKLLVYERGGFFLPHRDSEKHDRMVASLIVVLPNPFSGGTLIVRHGAAKQKLTFDEAAAGKAPCYAAFYADCEHVVEHVTGGVRLCLAYNLVLKPRRGKPSAAKPAAPADALAQSIRSWVANQPSKPLVFALEHHYTERGLSLDLLKGADRKLADLVVAAAGKLDCNVHLAQVSRHLMQFADDGSFGREHSYYYRAPRRTIEIGETYEDDLNGTEWTDVGGKKQPWSDIAFDLSAIVSSVPIDDWKPTSEEFEGYTGNAGNTLDRWYHRSAIVVWLRDHHFDVVAGSGAASSIPLFCSMAAKLAKTPKKRLEEARLDCIRFARAIIGKWPRRAAGSWHSRATEDLRFDDFPDHLLMLKDGETIALFLAKLANNDTELPLSSFVVAACSEFGWSAFTKELKGLLTEPPDVRDRGPIPFRDMEWLSAFCCENKGDSGKPALAKELCALAVKRFCEPLPPRRAYYSPDWPREVSVSETSLPLLLNALLASDRDADLSRVLDFVQERQDVFSLDDCQVPALKSLIPWSRKRFGSVPPRLAAWLASVRKQLESATAGEPSPPHDWARPADVGCECQYCAELSAFLADPGNEVGRIAASEHNRQHLIGKIGQFQCDVKHVLERKGSPYSLVLTKTRGSYERAVKRFEADRRLLKALPGVE
jgi:hypothetical protein